MHNRDSRRGRKRIGDGKYIWRNYGRKLPKPKEGNRYPSTGSTEVENHPHTNMTSKPAITRRREYKYRILKMNLKLKHQQLKTILFIHRLLYQNLMVGTSLAVQWLRLRLPMQGTQVRALVWEDPTCRGATGPMSHNYWACVSGACSPQQERPR